jgi:general secretion pathway protein A
MNAYSKNERVVLIVDEAQALNPELLEEIRLLSNLETSESKLLQIILIGQPELDKTLSQQGFRQLRQRINMRYRLLPLSDKETKEYINKRLSIAGARESLFTERAIKEIYLKSGGIPRIINILCDNALLNGYALDQRIVNEKSVREVAKDLGLKKSPRIIWVWFVLSISIIGGMLLLLYFQKSGYLISIYKYILSVFQYLKEFLFNELRLFSDFGK